MQYLTIRIPLTETLSRELAAEFPKGTTRPGRTDEQSKRAALQVVAKYLDDSSWSSVRAAMISASRKRAWGKKESRPSATEQPPALSAAVLARRARLEAELGARAAAKATYEAAYAELPDAVKTRIAAERLDYVTMSGEDWRLLAKSLANEAQHCERMAGLADGRR